MYRTYLLATLLFIVAATSYLYFEHMDKPNQSADTQESELVPDFVAEALTSKLYTQQGKLAHWVKASHMEHFSQLGFTTFDNAKYTIYPENDSLPWDVSANEAVLYDTNKLMLEKRVHLVNTDLDSPIREIHTNYLEFDLNTNIITSDQTIIIEGDGFTMYGSGLQVDLNTQAMSLNQHVQTVYKNEKS